MNKKAYIKANAEWLLQKATEKDVNKLDEGVFYKILETNPSKNVLHYPSNRSIVSVNYTGKTIDGKVFDSNEDSNIPLAIRVCDLIEGWIVALQKMKIGDKWEIYISADKGYGKFSQPGIPAGSTLIFQIELLGIA